MKEVYISYISKLKKERDNYKKTLEELEDYINSSKTTDTWGLKMKIHKLRKRLG